MLIYLGFFKKIAHPHLYTFFTHLIHYFIYLLLSRVGDRPTATILHAQLNFFDFCSGFYSEILDQNMSLLEGVNVKQVGGVASPPLHFEI